MSRATLRNATRRYQAQRFIHDYLKDHPCVDCGETDLRCLQFDHRDPSEKRAAVSKLAGQGLSVMEIRKEILKCDVRCANCHAKKTSDQRDYYKSDPEFGEEEKLLNLCETET